MGGLLKEVKINAVDVSTYVHLVRAEDELDDEPSIIRIEFYKAISDVVTLEIGQSITFKRGYTTATDFFVFEGKVTSIARENPLIIVKGKDLLAQAEDRIITKTFEAETDPESGDPVEIWKTIAEDYADLTVSASASPADLILRRFWCKADNCMERLNKIKNYLGWQMYHRPGVATIFEPIGNTEISTVFTVGDNILNTPVWKTEKTAYMFNNLTFIGGEQEIQDDPQLFSGDGSTTAFKLAYRPIAAQVEYPVGTILKGGIKGITSNLDYSIDTRSDGSYVVFESAPAVASNNIQVTYTRKSTIIIVQDDPDSIDRYGEIEKEIRNPDFIKTEDSIQYVDKLMTAAPEPFFSTQIHIPPLYDIRAGNKLRVVDPDEDEDRWIVARKVTYQWPDEYDIIGLGDKDFKIQNFFTSIYDRIKKIQNDISADIDIVVAVKKLQNKITVDLRHTFQKRDIEFDGLWGVGFQNVGATTRDLDWGDVGAVWGGTYNNSPVTQVLMWNDNVYREDFRTDDFKDSGSGDWDTTNKQLELETGEDMTSDMISKGISYSYVTVRVNQSGSGTLTFEVSADGKSNWQTITLNTRTALTNSDTTGVYWRASAAGGTVTLSTVYLANGNFDQAGVRVTLEE